MSVNNPSPSSSNSLDRLCVFIMAGGSGERFWPLSRTKTPKHLLRLLDEETLLEKTLHRFNGIVPPEQIFILTNQAQHEATLATLPHHPQENIIAEPAKRDTSPAAALATALALRKSPEALVALFPADAMIHDEETFRHQLRKTATAATTNNAIFTFSIKPTYPATGFGYLHLGEKLLVISDDENSFFQVRQFVEKPELAKAEEFLAQGHYGWNAGMFLWQASTFLKECDDQQPALAAFIKDLSQTSSPQEFLEEHFPKLPKISVDYAIIENAKQVIATSASFDWDDVGSWTSLPQHLGKDADGNTFRDVASPIVSLNTKNNIVISEGKTIALCGVQDLVVVQTEDAILISHRNAVEKIKQLPLPDRLK